MKNLLKTLAIAAMIAVPMVSNAQYYAITNQAVNMISTAINGGMNYRGYVDAGYLAGVGNHRANILSVSTTQGVKCSNTFFMGLGVGVDVMFTCVPDGIPSLRPINGHGSTTTGVAIPIFSDFRLNFGQPKSTGFFADLKLGASFLVGNNYIQVGDGYLTNSQCFYLKPTVGTRIPINKNNEKYAVNVGVSYQLMTSSTWYVSNNSMTLNAIGVNVGFEW